MKHHHSMVATHPQHPMPIINGHFHITSPAIGSQVTMAETLHYPLHEILQLKIALTKAS